MDKGKGKVEDRCQLLPNSMVAPGVLSGASAEPMLLQSGGVDVEVGCMCVSGWDENLLCCD
jgi:hypothetical protein